MLRAATLVREVISESSDEALERVVHPPSLSSIDGNGPQKGARQEHPEPGEESLPIEPALAGEPSGRDQEQPTRCEDEAGRQ
jgi:hypothetical protein